VDGVVELGKRKEKMNSENGQFLEDGIKRYEEARDTINAFEKEMAKILDQAAKNRKDWRPLNEVKFGRQSFDRGSGQHGYWVGLTIKGKSRRGEKAVIDCGIWWKCAKVQSPIIYANYYFEPKRVMGFAWKNRGSNIRSFSAWQRTFLYLPLRKVADIKESLNSLLSALLKQLA
jgi:hypothetical protein